MADKTYVCIDTIAVKESFDNKYKATLPKRVGAALAKAVDRSSKLTTKPPADKKAEGFYLSGTLALTKAGTDITAALELVLATWPKKSMFNRATKGATFEKSNPAKIDKEVDELIDTLVDTLQPQVVKALEKRAK